MTEYTRQEIIDKIKLWLNGVENTKIERVAVEGVPPDCDVFKITKSGVIQTAALLKEVQPHLQKITISYLLTLPNNSDLISVLSYIYFKKQDSISFGLLRHSDKIRLINMLKIPLMTLNLGYTWIPRLPDFDSLALSKEIFYDGFSKNIYFESVNAIFHGYEICQGFYREIVDSVSTSNR